MSPSFFWKKTAIFLALFFGVTASVHAFLWAVTPLVSSTIWAGRSLSSAGTIAKTAEIGTYVAGGGLFLVDYLFFSDDAPKTNNAQTPATITIALKKNQPRQTPTDGKWDPPSPGSIDPTPKPTFPAGGGHPSMPSTWAAVVQDGGAGSRTYFDGATNHLVVVKTLNDSFPTLNYDFQRCGQASTVAPPGYAPTPVFCLDVNVAGTVRTYAVWDKTEFPVCPPGTTQSGNTCTTVNAAAVPKPTSIPCEVTKLGDGTWQVDPKNPNCAALQPSITQASGSLTVTQSVDKTLQVQDGPGDTKIITQRDGAITRTITTGQFYSTNNAYPVTNVTESSGGNTGGSGTSGGTTGTGTGNCGGQGQPRCGVDIDDSGFNGKDLTLASQNAELAANDQSIKDKVLSVTSSNQHGISWLWRPDIPRVACENYDFGLGTRFITFDFCKTFAIIREGLGWLLYVFLGIYLFELFTSSSSNARRS
ncbi:MAG: hypothetical protein HYX62_06530 [Gammaproteobacteria bacterium]|nr:hypothetical protein [Gammaproteobacteria bacterium]